MISPVVGQQRGSSKLRLARHARPASRAMGTRSREAS